MAAMRHPPLNEPVAVTAREHGYFPKSFVWRGRRVTVKAVERCWTINRRNWLGSAERHCFRVRTADATYILSQDLRRDTWRLERVVR